MRFGVFVTLLCFLMTVTGGGVVTAPACVYIFFDHCDYVYLYDVLPCDVIINI